MSPEAHQFVIFKKYHEFWNAWSWGLIFLGLSYLYNTYHWWKFQKKPCDKGDMIQTFCMIWHGITPLKTWILQIQTITEKNKLTGYLIFGEIKFWNLKNKHYNNSEKTWQFYSSWLPSTMSLLKYKLVSSYEGV